METSQYYLRTVYSTIPLHINKFQYSFPYAPFIQYIAVIHNKTASRLKLSRQRSQTHARRVNGKKSRKICKARERDRAKEGQSARNLRGENRYFLGFEMRRVTATSSRECLTDNREVPSGSERCAGCKYGNFVGKVLYANM